MSDTDCNPYDGTDSSAIYTRDYEPATTDTNSDYGSDCQAEFDLVRFSDQAELEDETDRLRYLLFERNRSVRGCLHRVPLCEPSEILDIYTGNGDWANEIADKFEQARVEGIDSHTRKLWAAPNVEFFAGADVQDASDDYLQHYKDEKFDLVYCEDLKKVNIQFTTIYRKLKPGGVLEFNMAASTVKFAEDTTGIPDSASYINVLRSVLKRVETPYRSETEALKKCGFKKITVVNRCIPLYETKNDSWSIDWFYESCRRCALDNTTWAELSRALIVLRPCRPYYYLYSVSARRPE
ncbi:hypothetical protein PISL3812_09960 [Talaromyces islandicus]|uniref:Methyltransferase domain-containing protein n=1 Tax=Talaromyces islandicus TaxID=28573 RepID=A0A0U1MBF8_TALIS|nr:hypothetical protein PISL3812_09960 [Talaromyces islandicus]